jgi:plastocyanin
MKTVNSVFQFQLFSVCALVVIVLSALTSCSRSSRGGREVGDSSKTLPTAVTVSLVSMQSLQFLPAAVEIKKGDVLEWKNDDLVPHTATSPQFNSGTMAAGQRWRNTFTESGTFPYICNFHPQMKGVVKVK